VGVTTEDVADTLGDVTPLVAGAVPLLLLLVAATTWITAGRGGGPPPPPRPPGGPPPPPPLTILQAQRLFPQQYQNVPTYDPANWN
jgi:hypothetical protein